MGTYILIISLNVDGSNVPTTKYRLAELIQKTRHAYVLSTRDSIQISGHIHI